MKTYTTRTAADICLLCLKNPADNTRAHIITKLLTRGIFGKDKRGKTYVLVVEGGEVSFQKKPEQDTPVEDYMVCTACEKRMEKVETYIGNAFYQRYRKAKYREEFPITYQQSAGPGHFNYLIPSKVDPYLLSLFVWMQLWRASVTQSEAFKKVKLSPAAEEKLRSLLDSCLHTTHLQMAEYAKAHACKFNDFVYNVIMPQGELDPESQIMGARTVNEKLYLVYAAGLLFTCRPGDVSKTGMGFNNGHRPTVMAMMPADVWDDFKWKAMLPPHLYPHIKAYKGVTPARKN